MTARIAPQVIADGRRPDAVRDVAAPTQLIDIFPTIMDLARVDAQRRPSRLDGSSLAPLIGSGVDERPSFVVSQFHGCNLAASWFMVVQKLVDGTAYKLVHWGTGQEVPSLLYNLSADPSESASLLAPPRRTARVDAILATLEASLQSVIPYADVARRVARYNHASFTQWQNATGPGWVDAIGSPDLRWSESWSRDPQGSLDAVLAWQAAAPDQVLPCRASLRWPLD